MRGRLTQLVKQAHADYLYRDDDTVDIYGFVADRLIDNGVVLLPCKIGDTVYRVCKKKYDVDGYGMQYIEAWGIEKNTFNLRMYYDIGETVFLTHEAAEEALKTREKQ